jgi:hypothetical protein
MSAATTAEETAMPCQQMPQPLPEHTWLHKFVGEWEGEVEVPMGPGKEPMKMHGTESAKMLGGFWLVSQYRSESPQGVFQNLLTIGYDPESSQYMVSWVDSSSSTFWRTPGVINAAGDSITMDFEGPDPMGGGALRRFRETYHFPTADTRRFTSMVLDDEGEWQTCVSIKSRRVG